MNDSKPISTFDEICRLTIATMYRMDMDTLLRLRKQAIRELERAKLTRSCIESALALKQEEQERQMAQEDAIQPSLLD
ncbi:MAG: hypothetical protein ACK52W_07685 [Alphaproteobacteria bacterium]